MLLLCLSISAKKADRNKLIKHMTERMESGYVYYGYKNSIVGGNTDSEWIQMFRFHQLQHLILTYFGQG